MFLKRIELTATFLSRPISVKLNTPVTIIVGENGSGKSSFVESIAATAQLPAIGSSRDYSQIVKSLKIIWQSKTRQGFFFSTQTQFQFNHQLLLNKKELQEMERDFADLPEYGKSLAIGAIRGQASQLQNKYGQFHTLSHGEGFLTLIKSRLTSPGLYIIDEPEVALSFPSQLQLVSLIKQKAEIGCQFIIATHSPVVASIPNAQILQIKDKQLNQVKFSEIENFSLLKDFLNSPQSFLKHL